MVMCPRLIEGYSLYTVDCYGGVAGPKGMLKGSLNSRGYLNVSLVRHDPRRVLSHSVHRLVASAFCGHADKEVNHIDTDKANNLWHNLEWLTSSANKLHATALGLYPTGPAHYKFKDGSSDRGRIARRAATKANYQG